ncbi:putative adenosine monophosphate-protein transferase Fic [Azotobacter beijerinckii]|uniref:putative adenosine monophosphate-protein transferase Fic n=1 Tax=Azotobacter beijerinckii TaxID=170623 RepID=UPI002953A5FE|nr:putative adenosine monophosphate-protein transferase Fic [Azotobacter beijerinckii]MDV7210045.1 putative adenosine monophosphate-protein transferase Fic [Azotobacter beijerinckii]
MDKYGTGQDPYCYPGTDILRNRLDLQDEGQLSRAERELSELAASQLDFEPPPYGLDYLKHIHRALFGDIYDWAGELRSVDIAKGDTHFCNVKRIEPEAGKIFRKMAEANWFEGLERSRLIPAVAECFGDINMLHPFREGNGRAQRILFEHLIVNAGFEISWWAVEESEWIKANIAAVFCDYTKLERVLDRCIGQSIGE